MSTERLLTDLIADVFRLHAVTATTAAVYGAKATPQALLGRHCCECGHVYPRVPRGRELNEAVYRHTAAAIAAVVADWISLHAAFEHIGSLSEVLTALAAEAQKGADQ